MNERGLELDNIASGGTREHRCVNCGAVVAPHHICEETFVLSSESGFSWVVPLLVLMACVLGYAAQTVGVDAVRVVELELMEPPYNLTDTGVGEVFASYNILSIFTVLAGGLVVDGFGLQLACVFFSAINLVGLLIQGVSVRYASLPLLAAGRVIQGFGGEPLFVAWDSYLTLTWPNRLPLAMAIYCAGGRGGDLLAYLSLPEIVKRIGLQNAMWVVVGYGAFVLALGVFMSLLNIGATSSRKRDTRLAFRSMLQAVKSFPAKYWVAVLLSFQLFGTLALHVAYLPQYLHDAFAVDSATRAPEILSLFFVVALVSNLLYGPLLTATRAQWPRGAYLSTALASALLIGGDSLLLFGAPNSVCLYAALSVFGVAGGISSSALWGTMGSYTNATSVVGTVYAIPYSAVNFSSLIFSYGLGLIFDHSGARGVIYSWVGASGLCLLISFCWIYLEWSRPVIYSQL